MTINAGLNHTTSPIGLAGLYRAEQASDQVDEKAGDFAGVVALMRRSSGSHKKLFAAISLIACASVAVMLSSWTLGRLADQIIKYTALAPQMSGDTVHDVILPNPLVFFATVFLSLEATAIMLRYFGRRQLTQATMQITADIRSDLFAKLNQLPMSYFDVQPSGRTITRLTHDVDGVEIFFSTTLARLLTAIVQTIAVLGAMLLTDFRFGLLIVAASMPALGFTFVMRKPVRFWMRATKRRAAFLNSRLAEFLNGMPIIKLFDLEDWTRSSYNEAVTHHYHSGLSVMRWNSIIRPICIFLSCIPTLLILWYGGQTLLGEKPGLGLGIGFSFGSTLTFGLIVAFVRYSEQFVGPLRTIGQEIQVIQEAVTSCERLNQMLGEPNEEATLGPDGKHEHSIVGAIEYKDVWMSYTPERSILRGLSFKIESGMKIGIVGETGSGKSTTINLLAGLYPISRGDILIDGISIKKWQRRSLRSQIGFVSQDVVIFRGSLLDNLLASINSHTVEPTPSEIREACRATGLAAVMDRFPDGLNTQSLEGGSNFSMGERQLIALTRMLLRNPRIMILDEATANIDETCEVLIQNALNRVLAGRTCFIIAHRLSTILACDKILVFARGELVESGNHSELMSSDGGYYRTLVEKQLKTVIS